jgi:hypothetical protein
MLTFPALNGLGLLFEGPNKAPEVARTMILLPIINGLLCAAYIWMFLLGTSVASAKTLTVGCTIIVIALWAGSALWTRKRKEAGKRTGIEDAYQWPYAVGSTVVFGVLASTVTFGVGTNSVPIGHSDQTTSQWPSASEMPIGLVETVMNNQLKISLFLIGLLIFTAVIAHPRVPAWFRGFMGGFPIVPFGGLASITWGDQTATVSSSLEQMAGSVWASPIVPIWFIVFFTRYLAVTRIWLLQGMGLFIGWIACFAAIAGVSGLLLRL